MRTLQRIKSKYPEWVLGKWNPDCVSQGRDGIRLQSSELSPVVAFRRPAPKRIAHYERVLVQGFDLCAVIGHEAFDCVSPTWRTAIEDVEPAIHEFHPLKLRFKQDVEFDRFIFRAMHIDAIIDLNASDAVLDGDGRPLRLRYGGSTKYRASYVTLNRAKVNGKHWIKHRELRDPANALHSFVSAQLAEKIRRLMPRGVQLQAVSLI